MDEIKSKIDTLEEKFNKLETENKSYKNNINTRFSDISNKINRTMPPELYKEALCLWYYHATGQLLTLDNPKTFNEKIQYLKLYDSTALKTILSDQYLVREHVEKNIGKEYLIPLLGAYDSFDEIDFEKLPNQFVIKTNHASGTNILVKDKSTINKA